MTANKLLDVLQRILNEKVKVWVYTIGGHSIFGYIVEIGEDFVRFRQDWKETSSDIFIPIDNMDRLSTAWKEK